MRRLLPGLVLVAATSGAKTPASSPSPRAPSDREREQLLEGAEIAAVAAAPGGVTGSLRATLRRGTLAHDADIQMIDEVALRKDLGTTVELDFRDSYKNDVAAYRLDRMLGLGMAPVTVVRDHQRKAAAFTWFVDELLMTEKDRYVAKVRPPDVASWNRQLSEVALFDQLIFNFDRNAGNLVIDRGWQLWMIDHGRAFKTSKHLRNAKALGDSCERDLLASLRALDPAAVKVQMKGLLDDAQVDGLIARRDQIVTYYDRMIAERGERAVLYDLPPRSSGAR